MHAASRVKATYTEFITFKVALMSAAFLDVLTAAGFRNKEQDESLIKRGFCVNFLKRTHRFVVYIYVTPTDEELKP